jgi:hypothetical protein
MNVKKTIRVVQEHHVSEQLPLKAAKRFVFCVFLLILSTSVYGGGNSEAGKTAASPPAGSGPLQAEPGAEIEFVYWEGSTADKRGFDFLSRESGLIPRRTFGSRLLRLK